MERAGSKSGRCYGPALPPAGQVEVARLEDQIRKEFEKLHEFLRGEEKAVLSELHEEARHKQGLIEGKIKKLSEDSDALLHEVNQLQADLTEDDVSFLRVMPPSRPPPYACSAHLGPPRVRWGSCG